MGIGTCISTRPPTPPISLRRYQNSITPPFPLSGERSPLPRLLPLPSSLTHNKSKVEYPPPHGSLNTATLAQALKRNPGVGSRLVRWLVGLVWLCCLPADQVPFVHHLYLYPYPYQVSICTGPRRLKSPSLSASVFVPSFLPSSPIDPFPSSLLATYGGG